MQDNAQIILVDLPGIFKPRRRLDRAMVNAAWSGSQDADLTLLLVDAKSGLREDVREIIAKLAESKNRIWLVLNKTDLVERGELLPLTQEISGLINVEHVFMLSARSGEGVSDLMARLAAELPEGPFSIPKTT